MRQIMPGTNAHQKILERTSSRNKLIERTARSEKIASKGQEVLAQEIVQTVDLPHQIYIDLLRAHRFDGNPIVIHGGFGPMF